MRSVIKCEHNNTARFDLKLFCHKEMNEVYITNDFSVVKITEYKFLYYFYILFYFLIINEVHIRSSNVRRLVCTFFAEKEAAIRQREGGSVRCLHSYYRVRTTAMRTVPEVS